MAGPCEAGQYCQGGAKSKVPNDTNILFPENGPCISGHYCPEGTTYPVPCPAGMMRNITGKIHLDLLAQIEAKNICISLYRMHIQSTPVSTRCSGSTKPHRDITDSCNMFSMTGAYSIIARLSGPRSRDNVSQKYMCFEPNIC